ncbi:DASH complex subunit spc19 [Monosporozyma unispora]|nr:DASH complex subunit spc19 [Kazachstania unispora]
MDRVLDESIWHLEESITILQDSLATLNKNSQETNYLSKKMLQCHTQHLLATEFDMERATKDLNEEIDPIAKSLQDHLTKQLERIQRDVNKLEEKYKKNQAMLEEDASRNDRNSLTTPRLSTPDVMMGPLSDDQFSELKRLTAEIQAKKTELEGL